MGVGQTIRRERGSKNTKNKNKNEKKKKYLARPKDISSKSAFIIWSYEMFERKTKPRRIEAKAKKRLLGEIPESKLFFGKFLRGNI